MADAFVGIIVQKLTDLISSEAKALRGVKEELEYIKKELRSMNTFLETAEERQESDKGVKDWVDKVRELAYDAEDCIDEFRLRLILPPGHGIKGRLLRAARIIKTIKARRWIANEIQRIKTKTKEASDRANVYRFSATAAAAAAPTDRFTATATTSGNLQRNYREHYLYVKEDDLVGTERPKSQLVEWLLDPEPELRPISVVGTGGLGKTTLVKTVYDSLQVSGGHFDIRAWFTVSKTFEELELLKFMAKKLGSCSHKDGERVEKRDLIEKQYENPSRTELVCTYFWGKFVVSDQIKLHLQKKRYLIVLDDIWFTEHWEIIKALLPDDKNGSRVLVTTRDQRVAKASCSSDDHKYVYELKFLSDQQSRELFFRTVFGKKPCPPYLSKLSDEILNKCRGLPLAIVIIGGTLARKENKNIEEWQKMLDCLGSELKEVNEILGLSYKDLSCKLKRCFLYLSIFPEDFEINSKHLQRLWISEGFVTEHQGRPVEELAESYFYELVCRNMVLPEEISYRGSVKTFRLHDIMHEFVIDKATEENLVSLPRRHDSKRHDVIRRLSIQSSDSNKIVEDFIEGRSLHRLRTLHIFGSFNWSSFSFSRLKFLRVLHFSGLQDTPKSYDLNFYNGRSFSLCHLKYLSLRDTFIGPKLSSVGELHDLELFDSNSLCHGEPFGILKLPKLCYLRLSSSEMPQGLGDLRSLMVLGSIDIKNYVVTEVQKLGCLTELRKLRVQGVTQEKGNDLRDSLSKMSNLRSLRVWSDHGSSFSILFLDSLPSPSFPHLRSLELSGRMGKLLGWIGSLDMVTKIKLYGSRLDDNAVRVLQNLPSLQVLTLSKDAYIGEKLHFDGKGFRSLRVLYLEHLSEVRSLIFEAEAMLKLERLHISFCNSLCYVSDFVLETHPILKEVVVEAYEESLHNILQKAIQTHPNHPVLRSEVA